MASSVVKSGWDCRRELSLRTATIVIGCIHVIAAVLLLFYSSVIYAVAVLSKNERYYSCNDPPVLLVYNIVETVFCIVSSVLLIVGSVMRKEIFLIPFIMFKSVAIQVGLIFKIWANYKTKTLKNFIDIFPECSFYILVVAGEIALLSVVMRHFHKLKADKLGRRNAQFASVTATASAAAPSVISSSLMETNCRCANKDSKA